MNTHLNHDDASIRLRAALHAGSNPDPELVPQLLARCAVEPDFYVRDMLTWALTRHDPEQVTPAVLAELGGGSQARSQALHTLSKLGDPRTRTAITPALIADPDDDVARSAWRAAVALTPDDEAPALAAALSGQFGRGGIDVQRSLSRALVELGDAATPVIDAAAESSSPVVSRHAEATRRLAADPEASFGLEQHRVDC